MEGSRDENVGGGELPEGDTDGGAGACGAGLMGKKAAAKSAAPVLAGKAAVAGRLSDMVRDRFSTWRSQARCSVRSNRRAGAVAHHRSAAATGSHAEAREKPAAFMRHSC